MVLLFFIMDLPSCTHSEYFKFLFPCSIVLEVVVLFSWDHNRLYFKFLEILKQFVNRNICSSHSL